MNTPSVWRRKDGRRRRAVERKAGRPEYGSIRTAQFSLEATVLPDELLKALPAGANRVASILAALLIGLKGVLNPKVQVQARRGVTV
jgi:hypothetical protein